MRSRAAKLRPAAPAAAVLLLALLPGAGTPAAPPAQPAPPAQAGAAAAGTYRLALPPYRFRFPRDHAAHPEYRTEWWYYTGNLEGAGRRFGYELTFFQVGIDPERRTSRSAWALHTLYFAHFAVTEVDGGRFRHAESVSRPALGMAGARTDRYRVWIHDWSAELLPDGRTHRLAAAAPGMELALDLFPEKPPVIHGRDGVSQKAAGAGRASHYYSLTRLRSTGSLTLDGRKISVGGLSWMDHEFGSNQLTEDQVGWDWFSLQLDSGRELMLYVLRLRDGGVEPMSSGTLVETDGSWRHLPLSAFQVRARGTWKSPRSGGRYPADWEVRVPSAGLDLRVTPAVADQELATERIRFYYWEGSVRVRGRDRGMPVGGAGYVELTGYAGGAPGI